MQRKKIAFSKARDNFISYYFRVAGNSNDLPQKIIEQDLPNISQAFRFIIKKSDPKLSYDFWEAISAFLWNKYYWLLYQDWGTKTLGIVSKHDDFNLEEAWLSSEQGWIAMEWGDYDLALKMFCRSEQLFRNLEIADYRGLCIILRYLGVLYYRMNEYSRSLKYLSEAEHIAIEHDFGIMLSEIYNLQGTIARKQGDFDNAYVLYQRSIEILEKIGNAWYLPPAYRNLAKLEIEYGRLEKARSDLHTAIKLCENEKRLDILYSCQLALAELEFDMGNYEFADQLAKKARDGFISLQLDKARKEATKLINRIQNT
jgi:tetratricopeptide (TPR) repeat protein